MVTPFLISQALFRLEGNKEFNKIKHLLMMENITPSELAGFGVAGILVTVAMTIPKVDSFIANAQRRSLGLCEVCGDLKVVSCSKCKGLGYRPKGLLNFYKGMSTYIGIKLANDAEPCKHCESKGHLKCPKC